MRRDYSMAALCGGVALGILADRFLIHASAATWQRTFGTQQNFELIG